MKPLILCALIICGQAGLYGQEKPALEQMVADACPEELAKSYTRDLSHEIKYMPKKVQWETTFAAVIPRACFLGMQSWLGKTAFSLGHYGLMNDLKPETVSNLTELLSIKTVSKDQYVKLGKVWEKASITGIADEELAELLVTGMNSRLDMNQSEGVILFYVSLRKDGADHFSALTTAFDSTKDIKKARSREAVFRKVSELSPKARNAEAGNAPASADDLWKSLEDSLKDHEHKRISPETDPTKPITKSATWNFSNLEKFVKDWKGTPYKWGGFTKKGIDCSGFVIKVILSQFPESKLPRSARTLAAHGQTIAKENLAAGDLVFFAASNIPDKITHVGIYLADGKFAHASSKYGVTTADLNTAYYTKRLVTAKRIF